MKNTGRITLIAIVVLIIATAAAAAQIQVSWNPNTEPDLAGYKLYVGTASGQYGEPTDVGNMTETLLEITPQYGGTHYFALTAYDTSGNESAFSDEATCFVPDKTSPDKPKGLVARIVDAVVGFFKRLFGANSPRVEVIS